MNIIRINVDTESLATNNFGVGALVRVERSATEAGVYAELGTVAVVSGQPTATYYDATGATTNWYRTRYSKATPINPQDYGEYSNPFQADRDDGYTNVSAVKARLGITDTTDDSLLGAIVGEVNSFITERLGRPVGPEDDVTYVFDGTGTNRLRVTRGIRSVTTLTVASQTGATPVSITAGDIILVPPSGERGDGEPADWIVLSDHPAGGVYIFGAGYGTVSVTGDFGWAAVPEALAGVAVTLAVARWRARGSAGGDAFVTGVDGERTFERLLSWDDKMTLRRYGVGPMVA
jgi:hypothetical protein